MIGLGTWEVTGDTAVAAVRTALKLGYRHIDTAEGYRNHRDIARGLAAAGIARDDLFITSKVFRTHLHYDDLLKAAEEALRDLDIPYLDLYLVHWPNPEVPMAETFRALSRLQAEGLVRDIGVSNFSAAQIDEALAASANPISINQVEYHPYLNQEALRAHCEARGVRLTAYRPLGRGNLLADPTNVRIAARIGRTPAPGSPALAGGQGDRGHPAGALRRAPAGQPGSLWLGAARRGSGGHRRHRQARTLRQSALGPMGLTHGP
jgi:diketogulonate reductase-like aldo/keto reductase